MAKQLVYKGKPTQTVGIPLTYIVVLLLVAAIAYLAWMPVSNLVHGGETVSVKLTDGTIAKVAKADFNSTNYVQDKNGIYVLAKTSVSGKSVVTSTTSEVPDVPDLNTQVQERQHWLEGANNLAEKYLYKGQVYEIQWNGRTGGRPATEDWLIAIFETIRVPNWLLDNGAKIINSVFMGTLETNQVIYWATAPDSQGTSNLLVYTLRGSDENAMVMPIKSTELNKLNFDRAVDISTLKPYAAPVVTTTSKDNSPTSTGSDNGSDDEVSGYQSQT